MAPGLLSLWRGRLWLQVLIAMVLGIGGGILLGPDLQWVSPERSETIGLWLAFPGKAFLALIQMIVIPLILSSIMLGIASSQSLGQLKRLGLGLVSYFLFTTFVAVCIGLSLALVFRPGAFVEAGDLQSFAAPVPLLESSQFFSDRLPETLVNLIPTNPLGAMMRFEMLQVVIFAILLGFALLSVRSQSAKVLLDLLSSVQEVCMKVVQMALRLAPLAVFGLILQAVQRSGAQTLMGLAAYVGTVLLGLGLLLFFYTLILNFILGRNPLWFFSRIFPLQLLAFSTSSSAAVMPLSIQTAEEQLKLRPQIPQFIIPLGSTINMDGTALYQGVATVFLAQVYGVELGFGSLLLIVVTAVAASVGTPSTPGVGIIILSMVLTSANVPPEGIGLILGVDRILDMSRTAVNVTGDQMACLVMDRLTRNKAADLALAPKESLSESGGK